MGNDGSQRYTTKFYNLDAILSVGYRVNSRNATLFRQWTNKVLKEYLLRGYSVNQRLMYMENRIDRRLLEHDKRLDDLTDKVDFFIRTSLPPKEGIFYHISASIKDLGKKLFAFSKLEISPDYILSNI